MTIIATVHRVGFKAQWPDGSLSERHRKACLEFAQKHPKDSQTVRNKIPWSDETKIKLFGLNSKCHVWWKPGSAHHLPKTIPFMKHDGSSILWGVFFSGKDWEGWRKVECGKVHRYAYGNLVHSAKDVRLSHYHRCNLVRTLWMSLSDPARALNISGGTWKWLPTSGSHPTWKNLRGSEEKNARKSQIHMCNACRIIPKKTQGCNRFQRCFN